MQDGLQGYWLFTADVVNANMQNILANVSWVRAG